jgi:Methane oxygenase PmoA
VVLLDGFPFVATRRLALIVLSLTIAFRSPQAAHLPETVELLRNESRVDVLIGGKAFTTFHFDPAVAKPYLSPVRSARGTIVTRRFPMVSDIAGEDRDEPHQRALFFAHGDINGFDFWGEAAFPRWSDHPASTFGRTVFRSLDELSGGLDRGRLRAIFDLATPAGTIAEETQSYVFGGDDEVRTIDCEFAIHATRGPVTMGDTKEGTFAIRVAKALDSPPGHMLNANGASGQKAIWGKRAEWVDYYGRVGDEDVGVALFDHPRNPRAPTYWHARAYGLLAANPFGVRQFTGDRRQDGRYTIGPGETLVLRYRVLIHHGDPSQAQVAEAYRRFAAQQ